MQQRYENYYTTPELVMRQLEKPVIGSSAPTDVQIQYSDLLALAKDYCLSYSAALQNAINRVFVPYAAQKTYYIQDSIDNRDLLYNYRGRYNLNLGEDALSVSAVTFNGTSLTVSQYRLVDELFRSQNCPYTYLSFDSGVFAGSVDFDSSIVVTGVWGVHTNSALQFTNVTQTTSALSTTTDTTIEIDDGEGAFFQTFQYIRIDDELMLITDIDSSGVIDVLTVERGVNGYTATTHDIGATIERWNVLKDIQEVATRMVAYHFITRTDYGAQINLANGSVIIPEEMSKVIQDIAAQYTRNYIEVV